MPKKFSNAWIYFNKKNVGGKKLGVCRYCKKQYVNNATRMSRHLASCLLVPNEVKKMFQVEHVSYMKINKY